VIVVKKEDQPKMIIFGVALTIVLGFVAWEMFSLLGGSKEQVAVVPPPPAPGPVAMNTQPKEAVFSTYSELPAPKEPDPFRKVLVDHTLKANMAKPIGGITPVSFGSVAIKPEEPLRLDGLISGRSKAAIVSLGERTDVIGLGGSIGEYTLTEVDAKGCSFEGKHGLVHLLVGDQTKPPAPPATSPAVKLPLMPMANTMLLPAPTP